MFTGLIRHRAKVLRIATEKRGPGLQGMELTLARPKGLNRTREGDSVAINGVCLTVKKVGRSGLSFDLVPETLARSNLGTLRHGDEVNLEPSLRLGDQLGGHLVYGHVDATATVVSLQPEGQGMRLVCATPTHLAPLIAEKGYVCLDGVSLTVAAVREGSFAVVLIPETLKRTTLGRKVPGQALNIEADPVARYVAACLEHGQAPPAQADAGVAR